MKTFLDIINLKKVDMTFFIAFCEKEGKYRDIEVRFFDAGTKTFVDISKIVAEELKMEIQNRCVRIYGGGMNMGFALADRIREHALKKYGKEIEIKDHVFVKSDFNLYVDFIQKFLKEKSL